MLTRDLVVFHVSAPLVANTPRIERRHRRECSMSSPARSSRALAPAAGGAAICLRRCETQAHELGHLLGDVGLPRVVTVDHSRRKPVHGARSGQRGQVRA